METSSILNWLFVLLVVMEATVHCHATDDVTIRKKAPSKRLYDDLMSVYGSNTIRPVRNHSDPVRVRMFYKPDILSGFNEQNQQLSVVGVLYITWEDQFLTWDPDEYEGVERISLRMGDIWFPDITAYERLDVKESAANLFEPFVMVESTGSIEFFQLTDLTIYCRLNMTLFPFDRQRCSISFTTYSYDSDQVALAFANTSDAFENRFQPNGVWMLDHFDVREVEKKYLCCANPYVEIHYDFIMARIGNFYVYSIWIPSGLLSTMILAVFIMHPNSGEKVTLSVSNVLAFVLFQQIVVGSMPRSGDDSPVIIAFFSALIAISCLSVLASAAVLRVYHHDQKKPVPRMFRFLVQRHKRNKWRRTYTMVVRRNNQGKHGESDQTASSSATQAGRTPVSDINGQTDDEQPVALIASPGCDDHEGSHHLPNPPLEKEDTDWMILALMLDKCFLVVAVCALLGTVLYCGVKYLFLMGKY